MTEVKRLPLFDQTALIPRLSARVALGASPTSTRPTPPPAPSLYIHVPFCFHKCHYCDFYSIVDTRDRQEPFTDRLVRELIALASHAARPLSTIFIGGGTPSLLRPELWKRILATLTDRYDLATIRAASGLDGNSSLPPDAGEFTVECNPETVTAELMDILHGGGVTRVSMGAQSFSTVHLKTLERWHDPATISRAMDLAKAAGIRRRSIDLIFAIPGQTLAEWESDLRTALDLGTEHLSCYALTYEPNTAMTARLKRGEFRPAPEDSEAEMFESTIRTLRAAGLHRYEVSNFAKPGAECRHNLAYWRQSDWLAAGPSASAHVGGARWKNAPRLDDYLDFTDDGFARIQDLETPDPRRNLSERIMTGLRLAEGLPLTIISEAAAGLDAQTLTRFTKAVARQRSMGALEQSGSRLVLTEQGFLVADAVALDLVGAIDP